MSAGFRIGLCSRSPSLKNYHDFAVPSYSALDLYLKSEVYLKLLKLVQPGWFGRDFLFLQDPFSCLLSMEKAGMKKKMESTILLGVQRS